MYGWYAIQTASAVEVSVKREIERLARERAVPGIRQVVVPTEPVVSVRDGQKVTVERRLMPGYVLVNMVSTETTQRLLRSAKGVLGLVGGEKDPTPITAGEVERMMRRRGDDRLARLRLTLDASVGDKLEVARGPFAGQAGELAEVNQDGGKVKLLLPMLGGKTLVEIGFDQLKM